MHNCMGRILHDMFKYFMKHKTRHFFPKFKYLFDILGRSKRSVFFVKTLFSCKYLLIRGNMALYFHSEGSQDGSLSTEGVVYRAKMPTHI